MKTILKIPVSFKTYADFECNLRDAEIYEGFYVKKISRLQSLLFLFMIGLLSQLLFIEVKKLLMNLLKQYLRIINIAEK